MPDEPIRGETSEEATVADLYEDEEHPLPITLCVLPEYDASDLIDMLQRRGIGARVGDRRLDGTVEIRIHHFRLADAQAVLVEFTGDAGLVDEIGEPTDQQADEDDQEGIELSGEGADVPPSPGDEWTRSTQRVWRPTPNVIGEPSPAATLDDATYVKISSSLLDAGRLEGAGIDVRVRMSSAQDPRSTDVLVRREHLARAREVLGIRL